MLTDKQLKSIKEVVCRYDNEGSAGRFYEGNFSKSHRTSRLRKEFEFVEDLNLKNETILDVGCSGGKFSRLLMNENRVFSIDTSICALKYAKSRLNNASLIQASITHLPFKKEMFTTVLCIELLHHLDDEILNISLKEIGRVTIPDGNFICDLRNSLNPIMWYSYRKRDGKHFPLKTRNVLRFLFLLKKYSFSVIQRKGLFIPNYFLAPDVTLISKKNQQLR